MLYIQSDAFFFFVDMFGKGKEPCNETPMDEDWD